MNDLVIGKEYSPIEKYSVEEHSYLNKSSANVVRGRLVALNGTSFQTNETTWRDLLNTTLFEVRMIYNSKKCRQMNKFIRHRNIIEFI